MLLCLNCCLTRKPLPHLNPIAAMSAIIHDLPDALLGRILGLCGLDSG